MTVSLETVWQGVDEGDGPLALCRTYWIITRLPDDRSNLTIIDKAAA